MTFSTHLKFLKMKAHFENEIAFWKWKHILKLNPIPTSTGQNKPIYECDVTKLSRNRVKSIIHQWWPLVSLFHIIFGQWWPLEFLLHIISTGGDLYNRHDSSFTPMMTLQKSDLVRWPRFSVVDPGVLYRGPLRSPILTVHA